MSNRNNENPPDTNGDIGLNDYIEFVNSSVQIFDRSGTSQAGPFDVSDLFQMLSGNQPCKQSAGHHSDGVVRYDAIADRWVITTLIATPSAVAPTDECFAVSRSSDPLSGGWNIYDFRTSTHRFGDYPKLSLWPDGYYLTVNWFLPNNTPAGTGVFAFNRNAMLSGGNSAFQCVHCDADNFAGPLEQEQGMLFADLDGPLAPPMGSPAYLLGLKSPIGTPQLTLWTFHVDWAQRANSTLNGPSTIPVAAFNPNFTNLAPTDPEAQNAILQPNGAPLLEVLSDRLMYRLQYRNSGDHESMVVNHAVNVGSQDLTNAIAAMRWYELRRTVSMPGPVPPWVLYQQGTYAPDGASRWMASVAMDSAGDIAAGFSISSGTLDPSIHVTAHLISDPLNAMSQPELTLAAGSGEQTEANLMIGGKRWGDYTSMHVDPADDCTFWYTNEFYAGSSPTHWQTVIASFRYSSCGATQPVAACTQNSIPANDDGSSPAVALPFAAKFFGQTYSQLWVNNNGNVTFDAPLSAYTPVGLTATSHVIIAPFWADVDTRGASSALVTYGSAPASGSQPATFCVNWVNVGYFAGHADKLDSVQLQLLDRSQAGGSPGDFDIVMNFGSITWETGDASGGVGGIGGVPARVGYSNGIDHALEIVGSGTSGAFLDGGPDALASGSQNSTQAGRYVFHVRNGAAPLGGAIQGTISNGSTNPAQPVVGASAEFCSIFNTRDVCYATTTSPAGTYALSGLSAGLYSGVFSPPSGAHLMATTSPLAIVSDGQTLLVNASLVPTLPPPTGTTIASQHVNPDGTPVLFGNSAYSLNTHGCVGGSAAYSVRALNYIIEQPDVRSGALNEVPSGSGTYSVLLPGLDPLTGPARVTITISNCPSGGNSAVPFDIYIDPSGRVVDTAGEPVVGATVTLLRSDSASGPFSVVTGGSTVMSAGNRTNPDTTDPLGKFGWDVLGGFYKVQAAKTGCSSPADPTQAFVESPVLTIPPPAVGLALQLTCIAPVQTIQPQRLLDTRLVGGSIATGASRCFPVTGLMTIPADAAAVLLNVTSVSQTASGWLTVYPNGQPVPATSTLNFAPSEYAMANGTIMRVGNGGQVCVSVGTVNSVPGTSQVIVDATGYVSSTGVGTMPMLVSPQRVADTRTTGGAIQTGQSRCFTVSGVAGVPADAAAVVLNVTAVGYATQGWLTAYPNGQAVPATSTLNFDPSEYAMANGTIMRVGTDGQVCVNVGTVNSAPGSSDAILDVTGYLSNPGLVSIPMLASPQRVVDTRTSGAIPSGQSRCFTVAGVAGVPSDAVGVIVNITAVGYGTQGWLTAYPNGQSVPATSTLNFDTSEYAIANGSIIRLGSAQVCVSVGTINSVPGQANVLLDVVGYVAP